MQPPSQTPPTGPVTWLVPWERTWGMMVHLAAFAGFAFPGVGWVGGPLVVWLIKKDQSPYVDAQGKEALNFNLSLLIYGIISAFLIFFLIGFALLFALFVLHIVCTIIAAVRANNGEHYRYPFTIRMIT